MSFMPALHLFCLVTFVYMAGFVFFRNPKSKLNVTYASLLLCFGLWNTSDLFSHNLGIAHDTWRKLENISSLGWIGFPVVLLYFSLAFARLEKLLKSALFLVLVFALPLLLLYEQWTDGLTVLVGRHAYGWEYGWSESGWVYVFHAYYIGFTLASIFISLRHGWLASRPQERRQAWVIAACIASSLVLGTITDVLLPELEIRGIPSLANVFVLVFAMGAVLSIARYRFLTISPAIAAENIISSMEELLILLDEKGGIVTVNQAASRLLEYDPAELAGKPIDQLISARRPDSPLAQKISGSRTTKIGENYLKSKSGKTIPVLFSSSWLKDEYGTMVGTVIVAKDLTELKRVEEEKSKLERQLFQREKLAALGQLGAGVAHEINNPLGVILGFAQGMEKRVPEGDPLRLPVASIVREAVRCQNIVQELLHFSRDAKQEDELIELNALVRSSAILLDARAKLQGVQFVQELGDDLPAVKANRTRLQQVLVNLGTNAMDAMAEGGTLTLRTRRDGEHAILEVADTGHGIPEEIRSRIFEPFFTTKKIGAGTGLGLSLAWEIVQQVGGTIEVRSEPGQGTTMVIRLPAGRGGSDETG
ncbi:MAG: PAS domain-containing protein [Deltaproteobacteria bacterium]|nr:PAS domain-containing protein [Deltaproteobacteria bacterium]